MFDVCSVSIRWLQEIKLSIKRWHDGPGAKHGDPEIYHLHLGLRVTYADVIIVCFHDTLFNLKYFELQCTLQSNFACSSHNDPDETIKFIISCRHDDELLID